MEMDKISNEISYGDSLTLGLIEGYSSYDKTKEKDFTKVNRFVDAVEQALDYSLDILVGPEYNFVPNQPMTVDERDELFDRIGQLTEGYDTLVMPGSCFWTENGKLINTMPIYHNGELIATYDKMENGGEINAASYYGLEFKPGKEVGLLSHKGLDIGVEICADHGSGVLYEKRVKNLDLQIVSSCGMTLLGNNDVTHIGGYQIISDGLYTEVQVRRNIGDSRKYEEINPFDSAKLEESISLHRYTLDMSESKENKESLRIEPENFFINQVDWLFGRKEDF